MKDLAGKTALVTGAGSGLGRAIAIECAERGMRVLLADIDRDAASATGALLGQAQWLAVRCDVSRSEDVRHLADLAYEQFGNVNLLVNNAGVGAGGRVWTTTPDDWEWVIGVNVMGVVHGIQSFVPRMLASKEPSHVVNTASAGGLTVTPGYAIYVASKHAVVALTESLYQELLLEQGASVGVSVLCPAFVETGFASSERSRPQELQDASPDTEDYMNKIQHAKGELTADVIARATLDAVEADRFYILTHESVKPFIEARMRDIIEGRNPSREAVRGIGAARSTP